MHVHRILLGILLALGLVATALPATAAGLFGGHGQEMWFGASPRDVGVGHHHGGYGRHNYRRHDRHPRGHRRGPGKGYLTLHTTEHRHDGFGWHVHQEWRRQRHPAPPRHGSHRNDDWEDGAGIALGVLAGALLLNTFVDGGNATDTTGQVGTYPRILDSHSQQRQSQAIRNALDAGGNAVVTWANPANRSGRASGEVRIARNGRDDFGNPCREYQQTVRVGNRTEQGHQVACRDRNGNWHLQP